MKCASVSFGKDSQSKISKPMNRGKWYNELINDHKDEEVE